MQSNRLTISRRVRYSLSAALLTVAGLTSGACSFSSGGGNSPPSTVVVPSGSAVVCSDGTAPPCR